MIVNANTLSGAYRTLLSNFSLLQPTVSPRGLAVREALNAMVVVWSPGDEPIVTASADRNAKIAKYTAAEFDLYERGEDRTEAYAEHAPFWRTVADGETINSCYGKILWYDRSLDGLTPWEWAKRSLLRDPDTRQAVAPIARPDHFRETKDLVCTSHLAFHARNGALHLTAVMRSNDLVRGFVYDAPWFVHCQLRMRKELAEAGLELDTGIYTHIVHSMHVYERDASLLLEMLG